MASKLNRYQYETSPRKINPEYAPYKSTPKPNRKKTVKKAQEKSKEKNGYNKKQKIESKSKTIIYIVVGFIIAFIITYRNAKIDEKFSNIQELKQELSEMEKQNAQLEIAIESGLNLNNLAKQAKELLGMQKLTNKQTVYVDTPQNDYIQAPTEEIKIDDNKNFIKQVIDNVINIF